MKYELRLPALLGDTIPLEAIARAKARHRATAGGTEFHKPTYSGSYKRYGDDLLEEARKESLKVCNQWGVPGSPSEIVAEAKRRGAWMEVLSDEPNSDVDWPSTYLAAVYTKQNWLNEWGKLRGDEFHITSDGVPWFDERGPQTAPASAVQPTPAPHFVTQARPFAVPAGLRTLSSKTRITHERNIGRERGSGACMAGDYRAEIEATIDRQAQGYFTLNEAAQVLADERHGLNAAEAVERFLIAHSKGELPIHKAGSRFPIEVGETVRDYHDLLHIPELEPWLRAKVGYGFPNIQPSSEFRTRVSRREADEFEQLAELVDGDGVLGGYGVAPWSAAAQPLLDGSPHSQPFAGSEAPTPASHRSGRVVSHSTKSKGRDILDPVIDLAVMQAGGASDVAAVWLQLATLADAEHAPLLASTREGLKYMKAGEVAYLKRDALTKRLKRR